MMITHGTNNEKMDGHGKVIKITMI